MFLQPSEFFFETSRLFSYEGICLLLLGFFGLSFLICCLFCVNRLFRAFIRKMEGQSKIVKRLGKEKMKKSSAEVSKEVNPGGTKSTEKVRFFSMALF